MRITKKALDELIFHEGQLKHGPVNQVGVLRLALDLRQARGEMEHLCSAMEFIRKSGHAGSDIMHPAKILDWAREIGWKP